MNWNLIILTVVCIIAAQAGVCFGDNNYIIGCLLLCLVGLYLVYNFLQSYLIQKNEDRIYHEKLMSILEKQTDFK